MKIIYSIFLSSIISFSVFAQNQADLKYNLELNKTYRVKNSLVQNSNQTIQGMQQSIQTTNTVVFSLKPLKNIESNFIAEVRFDTINTTISMPQMEIYSSRPGDIKSSDPAKIMECIMNRLCNSTFLVKMDNTGKVLEFLNFEQATSGILQDVDSIQGPMADMLKMRAKMLVEQSAIKTMIESVTAFLPGKTVKIDEKWESNLIFSASGMDLKVSGTYKLTGIVNNSAAISGDLVVESSPKAMEMNGAQITPDIRGIGKTDLTVDCNTGWIIKGTSKQQMKGELGVSAPGMSMQIPIEINSDSEIVAIP